MLVDRLNQMMTLFFDVSHPMHVVVEFQKKQKERKKEWKEKERKVKGKGSKKIYIIIIFKYFK
jgi:hypothetical protein